MDITFNILGVHTHPGVIFAEIGTSMDFFIKHFERFTITHDKINVSGKTYHYKMCLGTPEARCLWNKEWLYADSVVCAYVLDTEQELPYDLFTMVKEDYPEIEIGYRRFKQLQEAHDKKNTSKEETQ